MQYGNQKYILNMQNSTRGNSSHHNETGFSLHPDTPHPISCSTKAPEGISLCLLFLVLFKFFCCNFDNFKRLRFF